MEGYMLMDVCCRTGSTGMRISYSRTCCTGLQGTVHAQFAACLTWSHKHRAEHMQSISCTLRVFWGVFFSLSDTVYCLLYSSELHLTVEWTLAIQGFNICGSKDSQETQKLHSLWYLYAGACVWESCVLEAGVRVEAWYCEWASLTVPCIAVALFLPACHQVCRNLH